MACELPSEHDVPLSRFSCADLVHEVVARGVVTAISQSTLWRYLDEDAIRPWSHKCWIFPRDPQFADLPFRQPLVRQDKLFMTIIAGVRGATPATFRNRFNGFPPYGSKPLKRFGHHEGCL